MRTATTRGLAAILLSFLVIGGLQSAAAQVELGGRIGYDLEVEELHVGAEARFSVESIQFPIVFKPAIDYFFLENGSFIQVDLNAIYEFALDNQAFVPYAGAGLGISRVSYEIDLGPFGGEIDESDTDVGLNLLGGAVFGSGPIRPFGEARLTFGTYDLITLTGGVLFQLGG